MKYEIIDQCRVCGGNSLEELLFLGHHPLANALKERQDQEEDRYPLTLAFCRNCGLVQIKETVDKEVLFRQYFWVTGTSSTAQCFAEGFCENAHRARPLQQNDLVVEIASNDGTFLRPFIDRGIRVIGVDPARNIAEIANEKGIETINAFWDKDTARRVVEDHGKASLIFARNVVPHVSELHDVMAGISLCLADDGVGAVEFHYAGNICEQLQYDAIYHEHLCYFSMGSFKHLLRRHGLNPFHVDLSPISGGAYVVYFTKVEREPTPDYRRLEEEERCASINELSTWETFAGRCREHRRKSRELLNAFSGRKIVGFGASARSSTYLNFCRFTVAEIDAVIDNNELKHHRFTPGASIPIVSFEEGFARKPELIFVMAWNFEDEIISTCNEQGYQGKFLIPFPNEPHIE